MEGVNKVIAALIIISIGLTISVAWLVWTYVESQKELLETTFRLQLINEKWNNTKSVLSDTNDELNTTRSALTTTRVGWGTTNATLSTIQIQLYKKDQQLQNTSAKLFNMETILNVTKNLLSVNNTLPNPTYAEFKSFYENDSTNFHPYVNDTYVCMVIS